MKKILKMGKVEISTDEIFKKWNNGKYNKIFDYIEFVEAFKNRGYIII